LKNNNNNNNNNDIINKNFDIINLSVITIISLNLFLI